MSDGEYLTIKLFA